jgi:hypothetical protein
MAEPTRIDICKAQEVHPSDPVRSVVIQIETPVPLQDTDTLRDRVAFFKREARKLERALRGALPGATYDQLLICMLQNHASELVVPYDRLTEARDA